MTEQASPSPQDLVTEMVAALKRHDLDAMLDRAHPDAVYDFVVLREFRGREAVHGFFDELLAAFPDFDIDVVQLLGDAEHAVMQWRATGTFTGAPFQGVHATGRHAEIRGCDVMRFEAGKLMRNTVYYDGLGFSRQIGLLPREGSAADKAMIAAFNAATDARARIKSRSQAKRR